MHWSDPLAQEFARRMFAVIVGRSAPPVPREASREDRSVLGAWSSQWVRTFSKGLNPGDFEAFCRRCEEDIARTKRSRRRVTNLGGLAMERIVPGVLAKMQKESV